MRLASALGLVAMLATPALAAPSAADTALVGQFAEVCLKDRLNFDGAKSAALADGWTTATADANPELAALIGFSNAAANDIKMNNGEFDFAIYGKTIDGAARYLVISNAQTTPGQSRQSIVGCYLYDFDATVSPDPAAVNALLGVEPTAQQVDADISSWQWNAPVALPGALDVYLNYVPEGSQYQSQYGFSGLVLLINSATATPTPPSAEQPNG
jgi:hypothetical protein